MLAVIIIVMLIGIAWCAWEERRQIILEGIIIGIVSGVSISCLTDANFQASIYGPFVNLAHKLNQNVKYISKTWADVKAEALTGDRYNVSAVNIASGNTVKLINVHTSAMPASLRYQVLTSGDENKK